LYPFGKLFLLPVELLSDSALNVNLYTTPLVTSFNILNIITVKCAYPKYPFVPIFIVIWNLSEATGMPEVVNCGG
jgi:hypothetical protein